MINLESIEDRRSLIEETEQQENKDRKFSSFSKWEILSGRITPYVNGYLKKFYSSDSLEEVPVISSVNLCKRITESEASLYKQAPERTFIGLSEEQAAVVQQVYQDMMFDAKMLRVNQFFKLLNQCHAQVVMKDGKLHLRSLAGHHLDSVPDDEWPEKANAYILSAYDRRDVNQYARQGSDGINQKIGEGDDWDTKKIYAVWSEDKNFLMDKSGNIVSEDDANELGLIPIVDVYTQKDFEYWVYQGQSDADFTVQFNAALTDLAQVMRMQGFSVAYLIAEEGTIPKNMKIGPNFLLTLPVNPNNPVQPSFGYANPGADIAGGINYIESLLSAYLTSRGLDPSLVSSAGKSEKYTSGLDRLLSMVDRFEASKSDIETFISAEKKLFKIIIRYLNVYGGTDLLDYKIAQINEDEADIEIKFAEPQMIKSEADKLDIISRKLELGLISKVEAIMEDRGLMDEANAEEILAKIDSLGGPMDGQPGQDQQIQDNQEGQQMADNSKAQDSSLVDVALNGAQVSSMVEVVQAVASGQMPRDSAVTIIENAFNLDRSVAERVVGSAGKGFKPAQQEQAPQQSKQKV